MKKIKPLGLQIIAVIFLANLSATYYWIKTQTMATSCMTVAEVNSDSRCLYILAGKIYEKGTRTEPHRGNNCGSDVTSIIPSTHVGNVIKYLDPNYRTDICPAVVPTNTPVPPTNTPIPQPTATSKPQPTATSKPLPTNTPRPSPTATQSGGQATPTAMQSGGQATNTPTIGPTPTIDGVPASIAYRLSITPTPTETPTVEPTPTSNPSGPSTSSGPSPLPSEDLRLDRGDNTTGIAPSIQSGMPRSNFWAGLSAGAWWGVVLTIASIGTLGSTLLIAMAKLASNAIAINLAKIKFSPEKPLTVASEGLVRGEIFEKLFYVTHFGSIDENNSWVSLTSDTGQILGKLGQQKITEGFYKVTGKKINQDGNSFIAIEKIVSLEKNG